MLNTCIVENREGKFLVIENEALGRHLLRGDLWEPHFSALARELLSPGDIAVDLGANIGYNSIIMAKQVGDAGRVIAVEPLRIPFQQLCANAILNGLENIHAMRYAIGDSNYTQVSMVPVDYHIPNCEVMNACLGVGGDVVTMMTLDSFQLPRLDFLKIDVQGCELQALLGAKKTLRETRPIIFIEIEEPQLQNQNTSSEAVASELISQKYDLLWLKAESEVDWLALPREKFDSSLNAIQASNVPFEFFRASE